MGIGPHFPGSDDVITSGKITLSESEKIETERKMQRLVKQGTETTGFRAGSSLHLCQYVYMQASMII